MTRTPLTYLLLIDRLGLLGSVILSGLCWYVGNGLTGNYWFLVWVAPIPILLSSFYHTQRVSYWTALGAYLLGRLSWFSYLQTVTTTGPALLITLALTLVFVRIVVQTRRVVLSSGAWYTAFAYPAFFTAFEYLLFSFSHDGTATSIAYSQANALPLIQVASVAGLLGVTFLISFVPSAVAVGWWMYRRKTAGLAYLAGAVVGLAGAVGLYGVNRLAQPPASGSVRVGLVALADSLHHRSAQATEPQVHRIAAQYAADIARLAAQGARVVVLTEGALRLQGAAYASTISYLGEVARRNRVNLVVGCTYIQDSLARNAALVFSPAGRVVASYNKVHLVRGFEDAFTPGHQPGVFPLDTLSAGVAICKDLDFPQHIRRYGQQQTRILFVPANDFVVDDWLHSRMAILRSVENGFPMVRAARHGRLTISDYTGRVLYEANTTKGQKTTLSGTVPLVHTPTFYTRTGDWIGIGCLILSVIFIWLGRKQT